MESVFEERWYQNEACETATERIKHEGAHPIIVVPTGGGKTHIISKIIHNFFAVNPTRKIIVLSHVKEILEQNHKSISKHLKEEIGLYSAMLDSRTVRRVTVAGIQSVYKKPYIFKEVGLIIIDECHLVTDENDGMYRSFLSCFECNYLGLTATPFRSRGYLHKIPNALFNEICYDLSSSENYKRLIREGYLSKLYSKGTMLKMDAKGVAMQGGDYNSKQLDKKFNTEQITEQALIETLEIGKKYKKWLIFAISIEHAESIRDWLNEHNINTGIVHSKMDEDRDTMLKDYRSGFYRAMVNVNVLTTGLDIPEIDLIVMLRPTKSPVIYVQSVGRGLRVAEGKDHCLVLDFANNVATHGPIDDIQIRQKGEKTKGEAITKECPVCQCICPAAARECEACGHQFEFKPKVEATASSLEIMKTEEKVWMNVNSISVRRHKKPNKPDSIRIDYICGLRRISQWAAIQSNSMYAAHSAKYVLSKFYDFPEDFEYTIKNVLELKDEFRVPEKIYVDKGERYPTIEEIKF